MNENWLNDNAAQPVQPPDPDRTAARRLAGYLGDVDAEPIYRLIQIFGVDLVAAKAHNALALWQAGQTAETYAISRPNPQDTPLVAANGQRRTRSQVFLYLIRQHCSLVGVRWSGLWTALPEEGRR